MHKAQDVRDGDGKPLLPRALVAKTYGRRPIGRVGRLHRSLGQIEVAFTSLARPERSPVPALGSDGDRHRVQDARGGKDRK